MYSRNTDLVTLCEDKVLKILANKDAVFNADGNTNLTATANVLGQTVPFAGEFGISTNPESFASENYRAYFSDKVRGAVLRLSMDGLTPISDAGMKDWFKDNLKISNTVFGSYDDKKDEYNITLSNKTVTETVNVTDPTTQGATGPAQLFTLPGTSIPTFISSYQAPQVSFTQDYLATLSFKESVRGWVSFKSFLPEHAVSMANDYYTFKEGGLYRHHDETVDRNTFYEDYTSSSIDVVLNDAPSNIKTFHTLNYEGSQSKVNEFKETQLILPGQPNTDYSDQEFYNLTEKDGWYVENVYTDKEQGNIKEFIEKEGKWFNNISKTVDLNLRAADTADFTFQGIGLVSSSFSNIGLGIVSLAPIFTAPVTTTTTSVATQPSVFAPNNPDPTAPQLQAPIIEEEAIEQPAVGILSPIKTEPTELTEVQALEQAQIAAEFDAQPIQQAQPVELIPTQPAQVLDIPKEVEEEKVVEEDIIDEDIIEEEFKQETAKESDLAQDLDIEDLEQDSVYTRRISSAGSSGSSSGGGGGY